MQTNETTNRESCGRVHIGEPTILRIPSALSISGDCVNVTASEFYCKMEMENPFNN
ncbi:hypothetical protein ALC53_10541 [Atta colombica]|uniref:Uncharacterized protein n=1 Tax=Atta colombica TaxID=520822 RepID=A0A195B3Z1_9HYME|nr:hypothetical protein ALC53_10541 [Atta colombica]